MRILSTMLLACALTAGAAEPAPTAGATQPAAATSSQSMEPRVDTSASPAVNTSAPAAATPAPAAPRTTPASTPAAANARDRLDLDTTQITGNRELPRVMYVVPWKRADLGDLTGKPVNSLLDEVLAPVDRDVFRRQNRYYDALRPDTAGKSTGAP
jgi:hypothetical protein